MNLVGLSFHNYKAFGGRESIEIRPLTVLIGKNSSGKSVVARLPLLLAGAFDEQADAPIPLEVQVVDFGASFVDLIHNRRPHGTLELGAKFELRGGNRIEVQARIQHYDEVRVQVVQELMVDTPDGRYTLVRLGQDPLDAAALYRLDAPQNRMAQIRPRFQGLRVGFPSPFGVEYNDQIADAWVSLARHLHIAVRGLANVGYLGPFRDVPQRQYRFPGGLPQNVGRNGSHAPQLLAANAVRRGGDVVKAVGEWYRKFLGGWTLDVAPQGDMFSLVLRAPHDPNVTVNLADAGTGLSQVLPLVVQRQFEEVTQIGWGGLEIVEQPELHLHPDAHGDLADLYIEATKRAGARFLIETHSENFILRIRRRIAEGLDASYVRIYSVEEDSRSGSTLKAINVQQNGEVDYWPKGVFSEDFDEVCAIREAQGSGES